MNIQVDAKAFKPVQPEYKLYKDAIDNYRFHGTERYYKFSLFPVAATDGAYWFADTFNCFWLLEDMASEMMQNQKEDFWVMTCEVKGTEADVKYEDGNYKLITQKHIDLTDLPEGKYTLWARNFPGTDILNHVIMLNTEY